MQRRLVVLVCALAAALSLAAVAHAAPHAPIFATPALVNADVNSGGATIGNVNMDSKPDLVALSGVQSGSVAVQLGNGDGTFQPTRLYTAGSGCVALGSVVIADLIADATPDLAVACNSSDSIAVLPGPLPEPRLPDFPEEVPGTVLHGTGDGPVALVMGRLDSVGPPDRVASPDLVVGNGDGTVSVLLADGNGGFEPKVDYPAGGGMVSTGSRSATSTGTGRSISSSATKRRRQSRCCSAIRMAHSSRQRALVMPSTRCSIPPQSPSATSTWTATSTSWSDGGAFRA
jgi:hypothetical protein